jgi:hypothetical protein
MPTVAISGRANLGDLRGELPMGAADVSIVASANVNYAVGGRPLARLLKNVRTAPPTKITASRMGSKTPSPPPLELPLRAPTTEEVGDGRPPPLVGKAARRSVRMLALTRGPVAESTAAACPPSVPSARSCPVVAGEIRFPEPPSDPLEVPAEGLRPCCRVRVEVLPAALGMVSRYWLTAELPVGAEAGG